MSAEELSRISLPDPHFTASDLRTIYAALNDQSQQVEKVLTLGPLPRCTVVTLEERRAVENATIETIYTKLIDRFEQLDQIQRSMPTPDQMTLASEEKTRVAALINKIALQ